MGPESANGSLKGHERKAGHRNQQEAEDSCARQGTASEPFSIQDCLQDPLLKALRALEIEQGINFNLNRESLSARPWPRSIAELCASAGLRHRRVLLADRWWESDSGPMLAFQRSDRDGAGTPGVLMRRGRHCHLFDPSANTTIRVDERVAAGIASEAYVFYRPLPGRPLRLMDLLHFSIRGQKRDFGTLLGATLCSGLLALLTPLVTRRIVDSSIPHSDRIELAHMVAALMVGAVGIALFELARGLTLQRLKSNSAVSLQAALWDRLLGLPAWFFRGFTVGDLTNRSMGIDGLQHLLTSDVTGALFALLSALLSVTILFYYSWQLGVVAVISTMLLALLTVAVARLQLRHLRELHRLDGKLSSLVYGLLSGIAKLRVAGAEKRAFAMWAERFSEHRRQSVIMRKLSNLQSVLAIVYGSATLVLFFAMVGLSRNLGLGVGDFLAFNAAFAQFQAAAMAAIGVVPAFLAFIPTYERMRPILDTVAETKTNQVDPGPLRGAIELRNVNFRYNGGPLVLEDVSLYVNPGEFVAVVGPSGSGKSTCLRMILGFEQPEAGSILIDGHEVGSLNLRLVRREIGVVLQHGRPLVGDIFHNIIGSLPLTVDDAWRAARLVGLEEEIRSMPMGMFTLVNQRGMSFSGGQRQRLLLARAIVSHPKILLLDEATSALDNHTQDLITRNLARMGITRIVIAHRLSSIRKADRIYVLEQGRVVEHGAFEDLVSRGGTFTRLTERQVVSL